MANPHHSLQASRSSESSPQTLPQTHRFDNVNLSGNASAVLGNVYHYHSSRQTQDLQSESQPLSALLSSLAFPEIQSRFQTLNDPYPETFGWIFEETPNEAWDERHTAKWDSFAKWLNTGTSPYWISGKLGTGKSTLMKYLTEKFSDSLNGYGEIRDTIVLSHFFWAPGSNLQSSVLGCLRTLLWQFLQLGDGKYQETCTVNVSNLASVARLRDSFVKIIASLENKVIILLDGLDECRETDDVLDLVEALIALPHVKLCVSSRREEVYVLQFSYFAKLKLQDLNEQDIQHFVTRELLENSRVRRSPSWNAKVAQDLADSVICNAEGVFLWVRLAIKELFRGWTNRDDLPRMRNRLEKLPQDIYDLYTELTRRDREATIEYAQEAAVYYQLLAYNNEHRLPLATFFFATNETVRARYLDIDRVFNMPLAELEEDIDLETLATWINVRSAGLLEVTQDHDIFQFNNRNRRGPCGTFTEFDKHWVGFIHRSAYTYLYETLEGQKAMIGLPVTQDTLKSVYFESQISAMLIVPGTYNFRFAYDSRQGFWLANLFSGQLHEPDPEKPLCRLLQSVFDKLLVKGLVIVAADWLCPAFRHYTTQYPTSVYAAVDLCRVFASAGLEAVEFMDIFMDHYGCRDDQEYVATTLYVLVRSQLDLDDGHDLGIVPWLEKLASLASRIGPLRLTPSKEKISLALRLASTAPKYIKDEVVGPLWDLSAANVVRSLPQLLPTCKELIVACLIEPCSYEEVIIFAALSLDTLQAWTQRQDMDTHSSVGRALFYLEWRKNQNNMTSKIFTMINQVDSDSVLESLRLAALSTPSKNLPPVVSGFLKSGYWLIRDTACFVLVGDQKMIASMFLAQSSNRGPQYDSFVDCLRYIGKSEEAIDHTVGEQVTIGVHGNWYHPQESGLFHELLGTNPQVLARWIKKFPALADCPGILQREDLISDQNE